MDHRAVPPDDSHHQRPYAVALAYAAGSFLIALLAVVIGMWTGARLAH